MSFREEAGKQKARTDGGDAFPRAADPSIVAGSNGDDPFDYGDRGMSLRDYFAGQALIGIVSATRTEVFAKKIEGDGRDHNTDDDCGQRNCDHPEEHSHSFAGTPDDKAADLADWAFTIADAMIEAREK